MSPGGWEDHGVAANIPGGAVLAWSSGRITIRMHSPGDACVVEIEIPAHEATRVRELLARDLSDLGRK